MPDQSVPSNPSSGNISQQTDRLFCAIKQALQEKHIAKAEALREKLMTTNPMALTEIIRSAELIEESKSIHIDRNHLAIWDKLYSTFNEEERNCLFYSLKKIIVPPGKILLAKGALNNRLFFIDKGSISICQPEDDRNVVLAELGCGDILGEYTFATISLCSATAITTSEVQLMCLESSATDDWEHKQTGLYEKLINFCMKQGKVDEIMHRKNSTELHSERHTVSGTAMAYILNREGNKTKTHFRSTLTEISLSGTSLAIKCSKKETARKLLARHLLLDFIFTHHGQKTTLETRGKIIGVSFHLYNDYTLHIQFLDKLSGQLIAKICGEPD